MASSPRRPPIRASSSRIPQEVLRRQLALRRRRAHAEEPPEPFGRLERYSIRGLFGQFDHELDLVPNEPTILTGANGTGKSTILKTINAVGSGMWHELLPLPFDEFRLHFQRAGPLRVARQDEELLVNHEGEDWTLSAPSPRDRALWARETEALLEKDDLAPSEYQALVARRNRLAHGHGESGAWWPDPEAQPDWVIQIPDRFPVRFIHDRRLVIEVEHQTRRVRPQRPEEQRHEAVLQYADDLAERLRYALSEYAAASQREDRGFPRRVVQAMSGEREVESDALPQLLDQVRERRHALEDVGLLESEEEQQPRFDESSLEQEQVRPVIQTFAEVTLRKFDDLEEMRRQLGLFTAFLNAHYVRKSVVTNPQEGFVVVLDDGSQIPPSELSSGEQQMLVLAYEFLFQATPGTLVLVDEPEISLHVGWQTTFVEDITEMGRDRDLNFLLATHSPTLIGGKEELRRTLDRPESRP